MYKGVVCSTTDSGGRGISGGCLEGGGVLLGSTYPTVSYHGSFVGGVRNWPLALKGVVVHSLLSSFRLPYYVLHVALAACYCLVLWESDGL